MKTLTMAVSLAVAAMWTGGLVHAADETAIKLDSEKDRISYTMGVQSARNFMKQGVEFDPKLFMLGLQDGVSGNKTLLSERDLRRVLTEFQSQVRQNMAANRKAAADTNLAKATEFLAVNGKKDGVVTLPSGLQYKIIKAGSGRKPIPSDAVEVEYRGTLLNGLEFDATEPGHPAALLLKQVIPGWKEALPMMPVGSRWQLFIPPQLAYRERGVGQDIGPNELLLFDLELVGIK